MNSNTQMIPFDTSFRNLSSDVDSVALADFIRRIEQEESTASNESWSRLSPSELIAAKNSVRQLVSLLQEVYQDHLLYDYFRSQDMGEEPEAIERICQKVSDVLEKLGPVRRTA